MKENQFNDLTSASRAHVPEITGQLIKLGSSSSKIELSNSKYIQIKTESLQKSS